MNDLQISESSILDSVSDASSKSSISAIIQEIKRPHDDISNYLKRRKKRQNDANGSSPRLSNSKSFYNGSPK